ncbi:hypothetical protein Ciccas_007345 [Cichlidogyrus casuarinus]|uniref:Uncharacterized protein n=1 Tax=Cichlidogyrus casuarinus TaxID=1844966 RepID=A0ABD2Q349_9PLAT
MVIKVDLGKLVHEYVKSQVYMQQQMQTINPPARQRMNAEPRRKNYSMSAMFGYQPIQTNAVDVNRVAETHCSASGVPISRKGSIVSHPGGFPLQSVLNFGSKQQPDSLGEETKAKVDNEQSMLERFEAMQISHGDRDFLVRLVLRICIFF